jgi:hypothetical protein
MIVVVIQCRLCEECLPLEKLKKDKRREFGRSGICKKCSNKKQKERYYTKEGQETAKKYRKNNIEKRKEDMKKWRKNKKEHCQEYQKKYNENNRNKINKKRREKRANETNYKIADLLRCRLYKALNSELKAEKTLELLGCSIEYFKEYIEQKFEPWMSWENHGYYTWHLDHIKPCALFDLSKEEQQRKCFHYTNFQPLAWHKNLSKSSKYSQVIKS